MGKLMSSAQRAARHIVNSQKVVNSNIVSNMVYTESVTNWT